MAIESSAIKENLGHQSMDLDMEDVGGQGEGKEQSQTSEGKDYSELQGAESDAVVVEFDVCNCSHSVPCFLRRVLREELGEYGSGHRLLVLAIHAVMLGSGFVRFNSATRTRADRLRLPDQLLSASSNFQLSYYTLPDLIADESNEVESVILKFRPIGHLLLVSGHLAKGKSDLRSTCLDVFRCEVLEFWKVVKDQLALPLLIDLSERAHLPLPSCLMRLPTELKLQILKLLDIYDLLQMALVSSEFRGLSSHGDVWKQKFLAEFGDVNEMQGVSNW
ncbi:F-box protein SKIP22-like [Punica granatum]|uniref:F-box protein SKIP22-like n=1 Tax=Punica granatum TaxID=22663 RepID=A0A6P8CTD7_PUNGR|nr:F-box protein SKIP22-like [Punica granatum]